jgi:hypothetical protein
MPKRMDVGHVLTPLMQGFKLETLLKNVCQYHYNERLLERVCHWISLCAD